VGFFEGDSVSPIDCTILVVAKAPVPGFAKTRVARELGDDAAAELAAAALLDTLDAVRSADVLHRVVAMHGDLERAALSEEIQRSLVEFNVIQQRGQSFGERLTAAHFDTAHLWPGPLVQIGMDTPQVSGALLTSAAELLVTDAVDAVYGPAIDGGWWALGLTDPMLAGFLSQVKMSQATTGAETLTALSDVCSQVVQLATLADFDTAHDVWNIAADLPSESRFRRAALALGATNWYRASC
jgi:glycosyltransferase A (GT-A) superfamily protein (DUF2064 family)